MQKHQDKACDYCKSGNPSKNLRAHFLRVVQRLPIRKKFAEKKPRSEPATVPA